METCLAGDWKMGLNNGAWARGPDCRLDGASGRVPDAPGPILDPRTAAPATGASRGSTRGGCCTGSGATWLRRQNESVHPTEILVVAL